MLENNAEAADDQRSSWLEVKKGGIAGWGILMENKTEAGDDQGSGWLEVKKKHRSSSKPAIHKASAASFHKAHDFSPRPCTTNLDCRTKATQEVPIREASSKAPDIKSSDLSSANSPKDEVCEPPSVNSSQEGVFSGVGESASCKPPDIPLTEEKGAFASENAKHVLYRMLPAIECNDLREAAKENNLSSGDFVDAEGCGASKKLNENQEPDAPGTEAGSGIELDTSNVGTENRTSSPVKESPRKGLFKAQGESENEPSSTFEPSFDTSKTYTAADMTDIPLLSQMNNCDEFSVHDSAIASMKDQMQFHDHATNGADFDAEAGESKERFRQRLWCFLFENLNRSIDELYLLCELECDMEQINEAILVLEEAGSDFQELKCRVEHFDNTKKSSPSVKDGMSMTMKADHQRPHALSWEVRRMTTSSQRAEILSSSLEAFKKIQLEIARKHATKAAEELALCNGVQEITSSSLKLKAVCSAARDTGLNSEKQTRPLDSYQKRINGEKQNKDGNRPGRSNFVLNPRSALQSMSSALGRHKREPLEPHSETDVAVRKDKEFSESKHEKHKTMDVVKKYRSLVDDEKEKQNMFPWKSMDAWKEKRNWEDILKSPLRSYRVSHSPGVSRKAMERARVLHDKLMSPEKKRRSSSDMKREAEEKHARAMRIRSQLESERAQRLQRTSEKLNRVNEWQAVRNLKLREVMHARHQHSESRHEAYLAQVVKRAGDETTKVNEVRFITSLNEENKKLILRQKLHDSEMRRAEKLQVIKTKQKEDSAREEAVLERRRLLEAEKLQRLAETQRKKEEALIRREEERKASSVAREARAVEQLRRKEIRAKAQQEEAELLAQKLAEKLRESEQRRKYYLEQIREKASMDFRDQSSPFQRRSLNKDGRSISTKSLEDYQMPSGEPVSVSATNQQSLKRRIRKIRQRLMAVKHEFVEPPIGGENTGIAYRAAAGAAKAKIGRWLQDLQRLRQARKEGAASIGLIVGDIIKYLEGRDLELHASRQAGMLDFISSALPASHTSKLEACLVTVYLLRLLRALLWLPANRSYFLVQNLLPPIIPMLSASLENYIKIAASSNPGSSNLLSSKTSPENLESVTEVLDGFLWTVSVIVGHVHLDDRQLQMQGGLIELIIVYQIIHRLRDLFALYDRPQVEGSPFPSSILFGLKLLIVLTSRPGIFSTIDWESGKCGTLRSKLDPEYRVFDSHDMGGQSIPPNNSGDPKSPPLISEHAKSDELKCRTIAGEEASVSREVSMMDNLEGNLPIEEHTVESLDISSGFPQKGQNIPEDCLEKKLVTDNCTLVNHSHGKNEVSLKQPIVLVLSAIAETGLVSLTSLLTAVLLQANNKLASDQTSSILPSNFEEVATGVLKVLNNLACLDISLLQCMLARPDLKMEFFHLISFLLTHCTNKWKSANDQVGLLLFECLWLLGYFALFHPGNQAVLRWGKSPTILHKVCDLPFVFFSDPELMPILAATLVAACYGCEQNKAVVQQELSTDMLLSLLKSCRQFSASRPSDSLPPECSVTYHSSEGNQNEIPVRSSRRSARPVPGKGGISGGIRVGRTKVQKDGRGTSDSAHNKHNFIASEASSTLMLHCRFPASFLDKAEEFFSSGT